MMPISNIMNLFWWWCTTKFSTFKQLRKIDLPPQQTNFMAKEAFSSKSVKTLKMQE